MPNVKVGYNQQTGKVEFSPNGGDVEMRGRGRIIFTPDPHQPVAFQSFELHPEDRTQFPRTVGATQIDVDDLFTDKQRKAYKYTVVVRLEDGTTKVGDPQIVNKPAALAGVAS